MSSTDLRISVDNGVYTFVAPDRADEITILRHGEPWHKQGLDGSGAIRALLCELDAARLVLAEVRRLVECWRAGAQARLERVLQRHDGLVSDRSPPSAWATGGEPVPATTAQDRSGSEVIVGNVSRRSLDQMLCGEREDQRDIPPTRSSLDPSLCRQLAFWADGIASAPGGGDAEGLRPRLRSIAAQLTAAADLYHTRDEPGA